MRTSVTHHDWQKAETVIPEAKDSIQYITKSKDFLFVVYSNGILGRIAEVQLRDREGDRRSHCRSPARRNRLPRRSQQPVPRLHDVVDAAGDAVGR